MLRKLQRKGQRLVGRCCLSLRTWPFKQRLWAAPSRQPPGNRQAERLSFRELPPADCPQLHVLCVDCLHCGSEPLHPPEPVWPPQAPSHLSSSLTSRVLWSSTAGRPSRTVSPALETPWLLVFWPLGSSTRGAFLTGVPVKDLWPWHLGQPPREPLGLLADLSVGHWFCPRVPCRSLQLQGGHHD